MKKHIHVSIFLILCLFVVFSSHTNAAGTLSDIQKNQYRESIQYLLDHWVVQWYPDGNFGPDREINRAEIMKIISISSTTGDIGSGSNCFPDVDSNDWFAPYVCYAKEHGIVKGYDDGMFKPNQNVAIVEGLKMGLETFLIDVGNVKKDDAWYQQYLEFVHNNNIFSKYSIAPTKNMSRGEMAYFIHQLMIQKEWIRPFTNIRTVASSGCGKQKPNSAPTESIINGQVRHYITDIGKNYDNNTPMKLIFAFHGRTNSNEQVREYYDMDEASQGNAIIIYPSWLPEEWPSRNRSSPGDKSYQLRDFALFDQVRKEFENNYCINKDEIFVVGHSLWAWFTNSLACTRGDVIRGIGSVGGGTTINKCTGTVAAMIMQNPADNLSSYAAWVSARDQLLRQNGCGTATVPIGPEGGNCVKYTNCFNDAPVIRCPYTTAVDSDGWYYPHMWPDYAGQEIRDFFESLK